VNGQQENLPSADGNLILTGLDGTNPLGFLAAVGVLRVLSIQKHGVKMAWKVSAGTWRPELFGVREPLHDLGAELHAAIRTLDLSVWSIDKELPFEAGVLRQKARDAALSASRTCRQVVDNLASFGGECFTDEKGNFKETSFRLIRSGDNEHNGLLDYAARTIEICTASQLQTAISSEWLYKDKKRSFRWDPAEDRGYALQWRNPSKDGALTERGANCLALFALPSFPTIPVKGKIETTGFGLKQSKQASLTWPIWKHPVNLPTVTSLLTLSELQCVQPSRQDLDSIGVVAAYRCNRVMTGTYYANFTPAQRVA
jgi:hypothetical protein